MPMLDFDLNDPLVVEDDYEPFIGQTFESQEEAYAYYFNYAKHHGYVVRKVVDLSKSQWNKESSRCECKAHMRITLKKCIDIFPEEWHVTKVVKEHNHENCHLEKCDFCRLIVQLVKRRRNKFYCIKKSDFQLDK
ncbi:Protein FAR1-RELATED SEQUENCE 11 [Bienertia sinuspersici]